MDTLRGALECVDIKTGELHRPELYLRNRAAGPGAGDSGRSGSLLDAVEAVLHQRLDASSAVGERVVHAVNALAHFERRHLVECPRDGIAVTRKSK